MVASRVNVVLRCLVGRIVQGILVMFKLILCFFFRIADCCSKITSRHVFSVFSGFIFTVRAPVTYPDLFLLCVSISGDKGGTGVCLFCNLGLSLGAAGLFGGLRSEFKARSGKELQAVLLSSPVLGEFI